MTEGARAPLAAILRGDAFGLPFGDGVFDVVVADPPYEGKNRGKKGLGYRAVGYVPFAGRHWWAEAERVLRPSGHLYVFAAVRELWAWAQSVEARPVDVISWIAPNNPSVMAFWQRGTGGRAPAWRPLIHWQKDPKRPIPWKGVHQDRVHPLTQRPMFDHTGTYVDPNIFLTPAIQSNMHEALPWPNQLPLKLLVWMLRPHVGARVLDLFSGTGTTRLACVELGLSVVSVDASPQAVTLAAGRPAQMGNGL